jgi:O-antigen/teichoic acid export membrane protein
MFIEDIINSKIFNASRRFFTHGHERSLRAKKNIAALFIIRGLNIAVGLALVPLTINYLDPTRYGIWITLSSIIGWFGFFDIGLGHGLRNRFAEALATGNHDLARIYVSTTYAILSIIIGGVLFLFYAVNPFINWSIILNAGQDIILQRELSVLALVVFTFFCIRFVFKLIASILTADQRPAIASSFDLFGRVIALVLIVFLLKMTGGSLLYLGVVMSISPVLVLFSASLWFFKGKYKIYRPSIHSVNFSEAGHLFNLGVKFFIIQIAAVILYQTNNIIISHLFGPEQVTPYNVAFKYFSLLMMGFSIVITPFWSAFTEAWVKQEIQWIKNIMRKLLTGWVWLLVAGAMMLLCSKWAYSVWIGSIVTVKFGISALVGAWVLMNAWNGIFGHFLNGVGKVKFQMYIGLTAALVNIPLAIFLGLKLGIEGVLFANVLVTSIGVTLYPLQYYKLMHKKAAGIWNK